jgi:hypothetical protein
MSNVQHNDVLADVVIDLSRCLLQYVGESWPWTPGDAAEHEVIENLVVRQQQNVANLADILLRRRKYIDFGAYPTEFTDLQYLALDHLLDQIVASERALVDTIGQAVTTAAGDDEAQTALESSLTVERENLGRLEELAASRQGAA